jgi:seryl-tRNA synthetase
LDEAQEEFNKLVLQIPNLLGPDVPVGKDDSENVVLYTWGEKPQFDFEPLPHREILEKRDLLDSKRAVKISGSRFVFFKDKLALLEMALMQYVMHKLYKK